MSDIPESGEESTDKPRNRGWFVPGDPRIKSGAKHKRTSDGKTLTQIARDRTEEAFNHILATMRDETANKKVRLEAANLILTRGWGAAHQQITIEGQVNHNHAPAIDANMLSFEAREQILAAFARTLNAPDVRVIEPELIEAKPISEGEND